MPAPDHTSVVYNTLIVEAKTPNAGDSIYGGFYEVTVVSDKNRGRMASIAIDLVSSRINPNEPSLIDYSVSDRTGVSITERDNSACEHHGGVYRRMVRRGNSFPQDLIIKPIDTEGCGN